MRLYKIVIHSLRAERFEENHQLGSPFARARHDDALAEERALVEPPEVLSQRHDPADHQNCLRIERSTGNETLRVGFFSLSD